MPQSRSPGPADVLDTQAMGILRGRKLSVSTVLALAAVVPVSLVAVGCGAPRESAPATTGTASASASAAAPPSAPPTQSPRVANWIDLQVGDCLAETAPTDPAVVTVTVVDCAGPHLTEVFLRAELPVNAAVADTANQQCAAGLPQYTGGSAAGYSISYLIDSEQDRTDNNPYPSTVICLLQSAAGQSLNGSARLN